MKKLITAQQLKSPAGMLVLSDEQRIAVRHIVSYQREDERILFVLSDGRRAYHRPKGNLAEAGKRCESLILELDQLVGAEVLNGK